MERQVLRQEYVDALKPSGMGAMDVSNAVWMMVPCYGGVIDYSSTSDSIVLTFLKKEEPYTCQAPAQTAVL